MKTSLSKFYGVASLAMTALWLQPALAGNSGTVSQLALTTNWADHTISLVNLTSSEEKAKIKVGAKPYDIKVDHQGRFAYATLSGASDISIIDIQANLEYGRIPVGEGPRDIAITEDSRMAVTANAGSNTISVVDLEKQEELYQIPVGIIPYGVALAADETVAVISNWGEGTASIVDLEKREEVAKVDVGTLPYTVGIAPGGNYAYITAFGDNKVVVLDIAGQEVVDRIDVGQSPWGLAVSNDGRHVAVANFYSGGVSVLTMDQPEMVADYQMETYYPNLEQATRTGMIQKTASESEQDNLLEPKPVDPKQPEEGVPSSVRAKNVAMSDDGLVIFTDLANNTVGVLEIETGEFGQFVGVGQAPYGLSFLSPEVEERRTELLAE